MLLKLSVKLTKRWTRLFQLSIFIFQKLLFPRQSTSKQVLGITGLVQLWMHQKEATSRDFAWTALLYEVAVVILGSQQQTAQTPTIIMGVYFSSNHFLAMFTWITIQTTCLTFLLKYNNKRCLLFLIFSNLFWVVIICTIFYNNDWTRLNISNYSSVDFSVPFKRLFKQLCVSEQVDLGINTVLLPI